MVDQETMILILYILRSTMVISWLVKVEYETMATKVMKPYYNHVETW